VLIVLRVIRGLVTVAIVISDGVRGGGESAERGPIGAQSQ